MKALHILTTVVGLCLMGPTALTQDIKPVLAAYLEVKDALVASNGAQAKAKANSLLKALDKLKSQKLSAVDQKRLAAIDVGAFSICKSSNVDGQRNFFESLSTNMIALVKSTKPQKMYVQFCPMADNNQGAYWLSDKKQIANPYFGDQMLTCGNVTEEIK